jgi:hypothetical protein
LLLKNPSREFGEKFLMVKKFTDPDLFPNINSNGIGCPSTKRPFRRMMNARQNILNNLILS